MPGWRGSQKVLSRSDAVGSGARIGGVKTITEVAGSIDQAALLCHDDRTGVRGPVG